MAHVIDAIISLKDNFSTTMQNVSNQVQQSSRKITKAGRDISKAGTSIARTGSSLTKSITLPIVGIGAVAVKAGMEFESSMSNIKAITGSTGNEMKELEKKAREMGSKTTKSAKEAADAMGYMGLAGWDTKQIMQGIEPVLRLSEAGNLDLARASDLVTDSMSSLGVEVENMDGYLDMLAQASRKSNTGIDQMSEAFIVAGGTFKNLNVPLDEASTMLGMLANRGTKGAEAGNSLNSIMINLTSGAGQAGKAMEQLGLSAFDGAGDFKGMGNVLNELRGKLSGMTDEQKNTYLAMIGGKSQVDTLNKLLSGMGEEYGDLRGHIQNSSGALNEMAHTMNDNNKGSITQLTSALSELGLKIYDILKPSIEKVIDVLQKLTEKIDKMSPETQKMIVKFALVAAAIGPMLLVFGKVVGRIGKVVMTFGKLAGAVKKAGSVFALITSAAGIVIMVLLALVAAGVLVYKNWDKIKAKVNEVFPSMKENIATTVSHIKNIFQGLVDFLILVWNLVSPVFTVVWEVIKSLFFNGMAFIGEIISNIVLYFSGIIDFITGVFTGNWEMAWQGIKNIFSGIFGGLVGIAKAPINSIIALVNGLIGGLNKMQVPDWVPGIGGKGINIPLIPQLAKGTENWTGGIVQVHEKGGEIIDLPNGSRVYPHDETVTMARNQGRKESGKDSGRSRNVTIAKLADQIIIREESDIDKIATAIVKKIKDTEPNMT